MIYELRLLTTESATGYFGCIPGTDLGYEGFLAYARRHPNDEFMRRHLLRIIGGCDEPHLKARIADLDPEDRFLQALLWEASRVCPHPKRYQRNFPMKALKPLAAHTPLLYLKSHLLRDRGRHQSWITLFRENILEHRPLPDPAAIGWAAPFSEARLKNLLEPRATLKQLFEQSRPLSDRAVAPAPGPEQVHTLALERLRQAGVAVGNEMRHTSSLSPIALLRRWQMRIAVNSGRHDFGLSGELTAYGRGIDFEAARAACVMEVVERCSSFASFDGRGPSGYADPPNVIHGRLSDLRKDRVAALDPNDLALEAPYRDEPLSWLQDQAQTLTGFRSIFIPAQGVFLFCNLDEIKLFSALGSTGLGAGVTMAGAKLSALSEVVERDCEGTTPFDRAFCFEIETQDERLAALLDSYRANGIHLQFQDLTPAMGLPCCKCFVVSSDGRIAKGTGAHLDARRALLAALTETPFPYPGGPPSRPAMQGLVRVPVEALPNYACGDPEADLRTMETLLLANGFRLIYADLTRSDIGLPVVRAIVPGMEILADFDRHSRVHPRLYANYLKLAAMKLASSSGR
ncbi:MAG: YcaO-like family protein [Desulfobacterales bacterium]|nr:YcaO-like family protein [Desulfobacterales bacterium]